MPAERIDQDVADRREQELTERARRGAGAEGHRAPVFGQELAEGAEHEIERAARQAEADQHAGAEMQHARRRRIGHDHEPERIEERAGAQHARRPEPVGDRAGEGLAQAPEQVLHRDGEAERVAAPAVLGRDRDLKQARRGARPEGDERDGAARRDDQLRRDAGGRGDGHGEVPLGRERAD